MSQTQSDTESSKMSSDDDETFHETHGIPPLKRFQRLKPSNPKVNFQLHPSMENYEILREFQLLCDWYSAEPGERFRAQAYTKIMNVLVDYPYKITSGQQIKDLPGIGAKTVQKVQEILDGKPDRLAMHVPAYVKHCKKFQRVRGVGPKKARDLYDRGCRDLKDIRPFLTKIQQAYLDHLDDLEVPIKEDELMKIFKRIKEAATKEVEMIKCELVGSFRRKSNLIFDVDILIYPTKDKNYQKHF